MRTGTLTNSENAAYSVDVAERPSASYLLVAPEARIGKRIGEHFEVSFGVEIAVLVALSRPKWNPDEGAVNAVSPTSRGDGLATFPADSLTGGTLLLFSPGLAARYDF